MIAVDAGNSTVTLAQIEETRITGKTALPTETLTFAALCSALKTLAAVPGNAVVASVVPEHNDMICNALRECGADTVQLLALTRDAILPHRLQTPQTTGIDRMLAARAAWDLYSLPEKKTLAVVIQAGTAVTVDAVIEGVFAGGYILPGPRLWLDALAQAAMLPTLQSSPEIWRKTAPGATTTDALLGGLAAGLPGAVERLIARILAFAEPHDAEDAATMITGGWAEPLAAALTVKAIVAPDLVLRGIGLVGNDLFG